MEIALIVLIWVAVVLFALVGLGVFAVLVSKSNLLDAQAAATLAATPVKK